MLSNGRDQQLEKAVQEIQKSLTKNINHFVKEIRASCEGDAFLIFYQPHHSLIQSGFCKKIIFQFYAEWHRCV